MPPKQKSPLMKRINKKAPRTPTPSTPSTRGSAQPAVHPDVLQEMFEQLSEKLNEKLDNKLQALQERLYETKSVEVEQDREEDGLNQPTPKQRKRHLDEDDSDEQESACEWGDIVGNKRAWRFMPEARKVCEDGQDAMHNGMVILQNSKFQSWARDNRIQLAEVFKFRGKEHELPTFATDAGWELLVGLHQRILAVKRSRAQGMSEAAIFESNLTLPSRELFQSDSATLRLLKQERAFERAMKSADKASPNDSSQRSPGRKLRCRYCGLEHNGKPCTVTNEQWRTQFNALPVVYGSPCWRCVQARRSAEGCNHHSKDCKPG